MKSLRFYRFLIAVVVVCGGFSPVTFAAEVVDNFELKDFRGKNYSLSDFDDSQLVVLAFMGTDCPLAKLYAGRLQELSERYSSKDLSVVAVNSNVQDSVTEITAWVHRHGVNFPVLKDPGNVVADLLHAERTPHVFLLDQNRIVRYHGRIDDQYVVGIVRDAPSRADLKIAIDELLDGKRVSVPQTAPLGCIIGRVKKPVENSPVTYSNQIARIFQKACVECHRPGEIAPFPLESYEDVVGWGPMIAEVVSEQRMPPWHADPRHGKFANDRSLSKEEKDLIYQWVKNGSPEGNPSDLPAPVEFVDGWQLPKTPDIVFKMSEKPFKVAASAGPRGIPYQNFWVDTKFKEDKWILSAEARPSNRAVVHHIVVYLYPKGRKSKEHSFFCAYVPGLRVQDPKPGVAKKIPAGSWFRFEMHYTPIGSEQEDLSEAGFVFADPDEVEQEVLTMNVGNARFELAPFMDDQIVTANSGASPGNLQLVSMSPHMHLRGKAFQYEAVYPDGTRETLLNVPNYDFNWQTQYVLTKPLTMPAGTRLSCTATFDNSEDNLANPDPSATVRWGDQSWDEMMLGYYDVMLPVDRNIGPKEAPSNPQAPLDARRIMQRLDANKDGRISVDEAKDLRSLHSAFDKVDSDNDQQVSIDELRSAIKKLQQKRRT